MLPTPTNADPAATAWTINDLVIRLRHVGSDRAYSLESSAEWSLGSDPACSIRLDDGAGRVSRRHASLIRAGEIWTMTDLGSKNGIRQNRQDRQVCQLMAGDELEIGGVTLIAESRRSIELHAFLERVIGWSSGLRRDVDRALCAVREMANLKTGLILVGEGSLAGVVRRLHRLTLGDRPLVLLGDDDSGADGLDRATNGLLCVNAHAVPHDVELMVAGLRLPDARVRLVACAETEEAGAAIAMKIRRTASVALPPLAERSDELERLLQAYAADAVESLGATDAGFRPKDPTWALDGGLADLDEIETVACRLVALRNWGVAAAAKRLGIGHPSMSKWAKRRGIPT